MHTVYQCDYCTKVTKNKPSMSEHERTCTKKKGKTLREVFEEERRKEEGLRH